MDNLRPFSYYASHNYDHFNYSQLTFYNEVEEILPGAGDLWCRLSNKSEVTSCEYSFKGYMELIEKELNKADGNPTFIVQMLED